MERLRGMEKLIEGIWRTGKSKGVTERSGRGCALGEEREGLECTH